MEIIPNNNKYILSFSFTNYLREKTGVPKLILEHQQLYHLNKISYVSLYPIKKHIGNQVVLLSNMFGLILDGEEKGIFHTTQIINYFIEWSDLGCFMCDIHIHHFLYSNLMFMQSILETFYQIPIKIYIHDYYIMCSNYNLLKNNRYYCGGKGLQQEYCNDCLSFKKSIKEKGKLKIFLNNYINRIVFISPSDNTKRIFCNFYPEFSNNIIVISHLKIKGYYRKNLEKIGEKDNIKVAFLGRPLFHKGWPIWQKLVNDFSDSRYHFMVFNSDDKTYDNMDCVKVGFSKDNMNNMIESLRENKVDIAVLMSQCPETYSYTFFEAWSANAFILTCENSGNIADIVNRKSLGIVFKKNNDIFTLFKNEDKLKMQLNYFREHTSGGPEALVSNDTIVTLLGENCNKKYKKVHLRKLNLFEKIETKLLNVLYRS